MLWITGLTALLLMQFRKENAILPAVTAVLLHYIAIHIWTDCCGVSTRYMVNVVSVCSYRSTATSRCYEYMD